VWLVWCFHLNDHAAARPKVQPPRLRGERVGLFASRTPFRPNPLALSLAKLEAIEGSTLLLSGVDLVNGTPVLDIKPYIAAYDAPCDGDEHGGGAQMREQKGETSRSADWAEPRPLCVAVSAPAGEQIRRLALRREPRRFLLADEESIRAAIVQCLAADPRPVYRWRRQQRRGEAAVYSIQLDGIRADCRFEPGDEGVTVVSVREARSGEEVSQ